MYEVYFLVATCFIAVLSNFVSSTLNESGKLIFVNVLYRHGDRTPLDPYPNDPYKNASFWPVGFGQLTNKGKMQEYELGKWLRQRYNLLLTEKYSPEVLYVQSTDVDRTLMSAESVLAGLFPPQGSQQWSPDFNWQPIPIHTCPEHLDKILSAKFACPAYNDEFQKVLHSQEIADLNKKYSDVYKILNENAGKKVSTLTEIEYIYNALFIEDSNNLTLPSWTKEIFPQPMEEASTYSFALPTWNSKLARLKSGLLVKDMISHMKRSAGVETESEERKQKLPKMWMYSAHDTTIANFLNSLEVFDLQNPPYSSTVLMELWLNSSGRHIVKLWFRNSSSHEPYELSLPGCVLPCPLEQFEASCQAIIPQDWDEECQSTLLFPLAGSHQSLIIAAVVVAVLLILLLVTSVAVYKQRQKRPNHCRGLSHLVVVPWGTLNIKPDGPVHKQFSNLLEPYD